MSDVIQLAISPVDMPDGSKRIVLGFHNEHFSQCVYLPYDNYTQACEIAAEIHKGIKGAANAILDGMLAKE